MVRLDVRSSQFKVYAWTRLCFGEKISDDKVERNHRFLEESLELVQSLGCTKEEALKLVDYVFTRPVGEPKQEVGGVGVTLFALCNANSIDGELEIRREISRINEPGILEKIRLKQKMKPLFSPLPE